MRPGSAGRARILDDFRRHIAAVFAKEAEVQSAVLTFVQYWDDNAADAVHHRIIYASSEVPLWPHACMRLPNARRANLVEDRCSRCGRFEQMFFDDNGEAIPAVESCCVEGASQGHALMEYELPYAIARRRPAGIEVEVIGGPVRPWLEPERDVAPERPLDPATRALLDLVRAAPDDPAPVAVLADHLLERGDPRGEYLTTTDPERRVALERAHLLEWLGPLAAIAPLEHVVMDRGFVRALAVGRSGSPAPSLLAAPEWATVEELWFLPRCMELLPPGMRALRRLGPIGTIGIMELSVADPPPPLEELHVLLDPATAAELEIFEFPELPRLRRLIVGAVADAARDPADDQDRLDGGPPRRGAARIDPAFAEPLLAAPFWSGLEELVVTSTKPDVIEAWLALSPKERPPRLAFVAPSPTGRPAGLQLTLAGDEATVSMPALGQEAGLVELARMIDALPGRFATIRLVPGRWFAPTDGVRRFLTEALSRPRIVV